MTPRTPTSDPLRERRAWIAAVRAWSKDACIDTVATMKLGETMMYAATDLISAQEDAIDALRAEVERLREGLEVLGALSDVTYDQCSEYSPRAYGEGRIDALLTVQRIVRAALLPTSQPLKVEHGGSN